MARHGVTLLGLALFLLRSALLPLALPQEVKKLGSEDATRVERLSGEVDQLYREGKFEEAARPMQAVLALCQAELGPDHWQTIAARQTLTDLRRIAALPLDARAALVSVAHLLDASQAAEAQGRFKAAESLNRRVLEIRRTWLGEEHPDTASSYNDLGADLLGQGQIEAAEPLFRKAVRICQQTLGQNCPATASCLDNLATCLDRRHRLRESETFHRQALDIRRGILDHNNPEIAISLNNLSVNLSNQGRYAEAEPLLREALEIFRVSRGEDHPETATAYDNLAFNLRTQSRLDDAEPLQIKALEIRRNQFGENHLETAVSYRNLARLLKDQGKFARAESLFRKALAIVLEVHGENHPSSATGYGDLAAILQEQARYTEAEGLYRKALEIRRALHGPDDIRLAAGYSNLALNLDAQGRYSEAEPLFRKSLELRESEDEAEHPETATTLDNLATNLEHQGRLAAAEPLIRTALAIRLRQLGSEHLATASSYSALALNLDAQGKSIEAEAMMRRALAIRLKRLGEEHPQTANALANLASILDSQGRSTQAESLARKALDLRRRCLPADHLDIALSGNNLGYLLTAQDKLEEAEAFYRESIRLRSASLGADHLNLAVSYTNLALNLARQNRLVEAESLAKQALTIRLRALGSEHFQSAVSYHVHAFLLESLGRDDQAVQEWIEAAAILERVRFTRAVNGLERAARLDAEPMRCLAVALARQGKLHEAWRYWECGLARGLLDDYSALRLRPLTEAERQREADLLGQIQQINEDIGRLAAKPDRSREEEVRLEEWEQRRSELRTSFTRLEAELDERYHQAAGQPCDLVQIQASLDEDTALIGWIDLDPIGVTLPSRELRHGAIVIRKDSEPIWVWIKGTGLDGAWTEEDIRRPDLLRQALNEAEPNWRDTAAALAHQRLDPLLPHLQGLRRWVVLPSPALRELPVEVLLANWTGPGQRFSVSYAPSASMLVHLSHPRDRHKEQSPTLLALGDPSYPVTQPEQDLPRPPDQGIAVLSVVPNGTADLFGIRRGDVLLEYNGVLLRSPADFKTLPASGAIKKVAIKLWRDGEIRSLEIAAGPLGIRYPLDRPAAEIVQAEHEAAKLLQPLTRSAGLSRLPGTRREVELIASLFPGGSATTLIGEQATESSLQELARSDRLRSFRFIHLAAHGRADRHTAMNSALILVPSVNRAKDPTAPENDGQITAEQIVQTWNLDADLVVLSACETGLGRYTDGEGYLGLAQAFFVKGARSLVVSLWKVPDHPTALLMSRFYQNLLGRRDGLDQPMNKSEALREAKEWLRGLTLEEAKAELSQLSLDLSGTTRFEPKPARSPGPIRPFEHPYHWAGFVLIGNPD